MARIFVLRVQPAAARSGSPMQRTDGVSASPSLRTHSSDACRRVMAAFELARRLLVSVSSP
jgi:hypothetical protein